jgi:fructokinase
MAIATIDQNGDAAYQFNTPAAWDGLDMNEQLDDLLHSHDMDPASTRIYILGTIAARLRSERGATSASTLTEIRNNAPEGSVVLDVNLRSPWYNPQSVLELARGAHTSSSRDVKKLALLKLNEEELVLLEEWCGFKADGNDPNRLTGSVLKNRMKRLATSLNSLRICVTRGENGAALWCDGTPHSNEAFHENSGYPIESDKDCDTVGAGDAFLAALVNSLFLRNEGPDKALERACALGGYVAGCRGATPSHEDAPWELRQIFQHTLVR